MVIDFSSFYDFPRQMERVFEEFYNPLTISQRRLAYPPVNLSEDDATIYVQAEIPGMAMDDIDVTLSDGSLVLRGKRESEKGDYFRQERPTGSFQRVISLNVPVDRDKVSATMKDGVVEIVLPKAEEAKPKKINIDIA
ncbi:MAG: Hsp20/alpha crystallin family protein [Desulfovibrionales bacterium]